MTATTTDYTVLFDCPEGEFNFARSATLENGYVVFAEWSDDEQWDQDVHIAFSLEELREIVAKLEAIA